MAKKGAREIVGMVCSVCKNQNYVTMRNKVNMDTKAGGKKGGKLELKKYCKHCKKYQLHKETTKLK
ncbi:50S ribosomal protein L33 [Candidatus Woesebacteria bacterium RIFCSPHIGHO2_02_FULL_38_9]|uniref:Large ribosomal subunit protein bL33 n=1 Tax=Candidatus Woesebacteria bacterium RIFCSPHIGHO2_01_FULL_39_28 TaxID=1802496 RepID=A0A1F7YKS8_9BACT|nr:MAG: 50S ribosomal protein L33 [Candidatus Woesebacteria bacterium RIFCSPHIGHO2_01_FULL_39_28]OGM34085.1 MAG: 50S ribosomal protein L33 [Candidatus Woesebacteria bacterium RIFCSPHIGHO2_02_FULL_38_9]OGM56774.1 MAG: 50S ribosomal protein L33 [Candidatus Woesebacteria bacterium RIFCSPLOWO2_01_FULL_38_20]